MLCSPMPTGHFGLNASKGKTLCKIQARICRGRVGVSVFLSFAPQISNAEALWQSGSLRLSYTESLGSPALLQKVYQNYRAKIAQELLHALSVFFVFCFFFFFLRGSGALRVG